MARLGQISGREAGRLLENWNGRVANVDFLENRRFSALPWNSGNSGVGDVSFDAIEYVNFVSV